MLSIIKSPSSQHWHCWQSIAHSHKDDNNNDGGNNGGSGVDDVASALFAIPACSFDDNDGSNSGVDSGDLTLLAVFCLLTQQWWQQQWCPQWCLGIADRLCLHVR
jgi:hypothetical protein